MMVDRRFKLEEPINSFWQVGGEDKNQVRCFIHTSSCKRNEKVTKMMGMPFLDESVMGEGHLAWTKEHLYANVDPG